MEFPLVNNSQSLNLGLKRVQKACIKLTVIRPGYGWVRTSKGSLRTGKPIWPAGAALQQISTNFLYFRNIIYALNQTVPLSAQQ